MRGMAMMTPEKVKSNLLLFEELLTCGTSIALWSYAPDGHLLYTSSTENLLMDTIFEKTGCKDYMLEYGKEHSEPLILGAKLGLMWCAAFERFEGKLLHIWVIGPVFTTEISLRDMEFALQEFDMEPLFRVRLREQLQKQPILLSVLLFRYALMLHYCVSGEKLQTSNIHFQKNDVPKESRGVAVHDRDRHQIYTLEQTLLYNVREGKLDYNAEFNRAGNLSNGVQIKTRTPLQQALISTSGFVTLCVRAAIEGGLSPETAYALGDRYIQSMIECKTVTDLRVINHEMYHDFIVRVHKHRTDPKISKQIQRCCDYIELHMEEPLTIQQLAEQTGYTDYYLSRKFKRETNSGIKDYILFVRVERAKLLLRTTKLSVQEIAEKLQFCSSSYFAKKFQKVTGMSPQQWRECGISI